MHESACTNDIATPLLFRCLCILATQSFAVGSRVACPVCDGATDLGWRVLVV